MQRSTPFSIFFGHHALSLTLATLLAASACVSDETDTSPGTDTGSSSNTGTTSSTSTHSTTSDSSGSSTTSGSDSTATQSTDSSGTDTTPGACTPLVSDFRPGAADDGFAACISDDATYHLAGSETPGASARLTAYEAIGDLLWRGAQPLAPDKFDMARVQYETAEGLASRVARREDLHYTEIPKAEQDPGVDWDKQCSVAALADKYPDRCPGPKKIGPKISEAFILGQSAGNDTAALAGRIHGALDWFLVLSVYKEAYTCFSIKAEDCDAAWAYYNGGVTQSGPAQVGLAKVIAGIDAEADAKIFEAILGVRCVRDLYPATTYPTFESLPQDGKDLFNKAWEQLDNALHHGYALVVKQALLELAANPTDTGKVAYVQTAGPVLELEASARGATTVQIAALQAAWAASAPVAADFQTAADTLTAIFPCPQP